MKKILLVILLFLATGCDNVEVIENPNGSSLTYKYFESQNYDGNEFNLHLRNGSSEIVIHKKDDNIYYELSGNASLIILEKDGLRYNIDSVNKVYTSSPVIKKENYTSGILIDDMDELKTKSYKTGVEKINAHKYTFEEYNYNGVKTTYYFKDTLKFIRKKSSSENLLYEVISFNTKVEDKKFNLPKGYESMAY